MISRKENFRRPIMAMRIEAPLFLNLVYRENDESLQEKDMDGWMITVYFWSASLRSEFSHWSETLKLFSQTHQPPGSPWTQITYFQPNHRWKLRKRGAAPRPPSRSPVGERLRLGGAQCPSSNSNSDRFHARIFANVRIRIILDFCPFFFNQHSIFHLNTNKRKVQTKITN